MIQSMSRRTYPFLALFLSLTNLVLSQKTTLTTDSTRRAGQDTTPYIRFYLINSDAFCFRKYKCPCQMSKNFVFNVYNWNGKKFGPQRTRRNRLKLSYYTTRKDGREKFRPATTFYIQELLHPISFKTNFVLSACLTNRHTLSSNVLRLNLLLFGTQNIYILTFLQTICATVHTMMIL